MLRPTNLVLSGGGVLGYGQIGALIRLVVDYFKQLRFAPHIAHSQPLITPPLLAKL